MNAILFPLTDLNSPQGQSIIQSIKVMKQFPPEEELLPPVEAMEEALSGELTVVRHMPDGEINNDVPHMTITFSEPMIAIGSVQDVSDQGNAGVSIVPDVEGRFRWLGSKTLIFEPEYRFPMSTDFIVTVRFLLHDPDLKMVDD